MAIPGAFATLSGKWTGTKAVIEPDEPRHEGPCAATVGEAMQGQFLELRYDWSYEGTPQSGVLLLGMSDEAAKAAWFDSWHNAHTWMTLTGTLASPSSVDLRGSYPVDGGPDWGWRVVLTAGADAISVDMYNVTPEGEEMIGVEIRLGRA